MAETGRCCAMLVVDCTRSFSGWHGEATGVEARGFLDDYILSKALEDGFGSPVFCRVMKFVVVGNGNDERFV